MFTGIIQEVGTVVSVKRARSLIQLIVRAPKTAALVKRKESVSINGVCLTVVQSVRGRLVFEIIPETQDLTGLSVLRAKSCVNVEPSLLLSDRLNGHFVFGHIDGTGTVVRKAKRGGEQVLWIQISAGLRKLIVPKGPVAVDGVSLTVGMKPAAGTFSIHLIPETLRQTTLCFRQIGDRVNIECDYLAKVLVALKNGIPGQ